MKRALSFAFVALAVASAHAGLVEESFDTFALGKLDGQAGYRDGSGRDAFRVVASGTGKAIEVDSRELDAGAAVGVRAPLIIQPTFADPDFSVFVDVTSTAVAEGLPIDSDPGSFGLSLTQNGNHVATITVASYLFGGITVGDIGPWGNRTGGDRILRDVPKRLGIAFQSGTGVQTITLSVDGETFLSRTLFANARDPFSVELKAGRGANRGRFDNLTAVGNVTNPVPEPATFAALGLGALALLKRRRP